MYRTTYPSSCSQGWTENEALRNRSEKSVVAAVDAIRARLPYAGTLYALGLGLSCLGLITRALVKPPEGVSVITKLSVVKRENGA